MFGKPYKCVKCKIGLAVQDLFNHENGFQCKDCFKKRYIDFHEGKQWEHVSGLGVPNEFNEPEHYHKHKIDTIQFLQEGFPPSVFKGFAIGSAIKYIHRYENKNGMEDLLKAEDYIKRLISFHKKDHS